MKEISGANAGIIIAVVVIVVGVVAYFGLIHQTKASPQAMKASMEKGMAKSMAEQMRARYQNQHAQPGQPVQGR